MFKKETIGYDKNDESEYLDILKRTNLLYSRKTNKLPLLCANKDVKRKYERIIEPSLGRARSSSVPTIQTRSRVGKGLITLMKANKKPFEYRYFYDYNEIVDRLRLLLASEAAGNNALSNEIISIIEELKEANIIKLISINGKNPILPNSLKGSTINKGDILQVVRNANSPLARDVFIEIVLLVSSQ